MEAGKYGAVASSFVVEQVGLPTLKGGNVREFWNGESAEHRLEEYKKRCEVVEGRS